MGGERAFELEDVLLLPGPTGHLFTTKSAPTQAVSTPPEEVPKRFLLFPSFGYRQSQGVWKPLREEDPRAWGSCTHSALLSSIGQFVLGGNALPAPKTSGGGSWPGGPRSGLPESYKLRPLARAAEEGAGESSTQAGRPRSPSRTPITFL